MIECTHSTKSSRTISNGLVIVSRTRVAARKVDDQCRQSTSSSNP